jgi:putative DNA primase/helicase
MPRSPRPARSRRAAVTLPHDSEITQAKALVWLLRNPDDGAVEPRFFSSRELGAIAEAVVEVGPGGQSEAIIAAAASRGLAESDVVGAFDLVNAHANVPDDELKKAVRELRQLWASRAHLVGEITADDLVRYFTLDDGLDDGGELVTVTADRVEIKPIRWLWPNYVPLGKITLVAGRPKTGKSVLLVDLAARVSSGRPMPYADQSITVRGRVILCMAEDDAADMVAPRLKAAAADMGMVEIFDFIDTGRGERGLDISRDIAKLERRCKEVGDVALIIIDPIMSFIGADTDTNNDASTRYALWPLKALAERLGVAVILNSHTRKGASGDLQDLIMGSTAFAGVPRALFGLLPDPRERSRRLLMSFGTNIATEKTPTLAYTIRSSDVPGTFDAPSVAWEDRPVHDLDQNEYHRLIREEAARSAGSEITKATDFLDRVLGKGPMASASLERLASAEGISERTLKRARSERECATKRLGDGTWMVGLPGAFDPPPTP